MMGTNADARLGVILVASRLAMETRRAILSAHALDRVTPPTGEKADPVSGNKETPKAVNVAKRTSRS